MDIKFVKKVILFIMQRLIIKSMVCRVVETFLVSMLLVSCKKSLPEVLTGGSFRYWLYLQGESSSPQDSARNASRCSRKDAFHLYFDKTGQFIVYFGGYEIFDYYYIPKWKVTNDSIIDILNHQYRLERYTNDKVLLKSEIMGSESIVVDTLEAIDMDKVPRKYRKYRKLPPPPKGILIL